MRNLWKVSLAVAALVASPALAQPPGGFGFGGPSLLTNKSVQEELKLTKAQKDKLAEVAKKTREKMQEAFQKFQDLKPEERREKLQAVRKETTATLNKAANLTDTQKTRFAQIELQQSERMRGPVVFTDANVQKALKFTDEQKADIKKVTEDLTKQIREETKDLPRDRESFAKRREITTKLNKDAMGKVASKLTADQKATWKKMLGKPFEVKFERPMRPGGGGGRPPRPGRVEF